MSITKNKTPSFLLFILFFLATNTMYAQHCVFCTTQLITVEVTDATTKKVIPNLELTLLDSLQQPIKNTTRDVQFKAMDPIYNYDSLYVFHYNTKKHFPSLNGELFSSELPVQRNLYFILLPSVAPRPFFIKIHDAEQRYQTKEIPIEHMQALCRKQEIWRDINKQQKHINKVTLTLKKD